MNKTEETMAEQSAEDVAAAETETDGGGSSIIGTKYTVVAGDNLWDIAADQLGSGAKWPEIAEANGLSRPYLLSIGQELNLPSN